MGTLWNQSNQLVFTNDGIIAPGAKAYFFVSGTSTPKTVYQDGDESTARTHPVVADGNGRWPAVFVPYGSYKYYITTSGGSAIGSTIDNVPNPEPFDETFEVDETAQLNTGDMWFSFVDGTRSGAVRCNGRTIGSASSAATERANADAADLFAFLWNALDNTAAPVSTGRGASAAADFAANKTLTLPDLRGAMPIGLSDMGNTDLGSLVNAPVSTGSATTPGSILGANTHVLTTAELPTFTPASTLNQFTPTGAVSPSSYTPLGSVSPASYTPTGSVSVSDTRTWKTAANIVGSAGGAKSATGPGSAWGESHQSDVTINSGSISSAFTGNAQAFTFTGSAQSFTFSGSAGTITGTSIGSSQAHNNVPKVITGTWFMKL